MRERWSIGAGSDADRTNDSIFDWGTNKQRDAETTAFDDALEVNRRLYVDPNTSKDVKDKARRDIEGSIQAGQASGLLDPNAAAARRKSYLDQADLNRGLLEVELRPETVLPGGSAVGYGNPRLPAGMRNNNPGNIKFVGRGQAPGVVGPSANTDQGDPQAVFATPEAGMRAAYDLAVRKYEGGKTTANDLIAGQGGWTPGNSDAAANIAATMGIGPDDDLNLKNPESAKKFLRALVTQEHGPSSQAYTDSMITNAVSGKVAPPAAPRSTGADLPIVFGNTAGRVSAVPDMEGIHPEVIDRFKSLQNAFGSSVPVVSGYRDAARNERAGGAKRSQHLEGNALDLDVSKMSQEERIRLIQTARAQGFGGIGVYGNSIHVDTGPVRAWGASHHSDSVPLWAREAVNAPAGAGPTQEMPDWYSRLSPEDQFRVRKQAETVQNQQRVEKRANIDVAVTNGPAAMLNTGTYTGNQPSADDFFQAYGPQEGADRYNTFVASMQTGQQAFSMRTMSAEDIQTMVNQAKPTSTGDDAALQSKRYETLSNAADTTLKAREADPASYVRQAFPSVNQAWSDAQAAGNYQGGVAASITAQQQIGIKNVQPLPKEIATNAVGAFKDETQPQQNRIAAVSSILMATPDRTQRQALFNQMVGAGLPDITEGAFEALTRGDQGAANRLFQAAMVDPTKLAGAPKDGQKPADIDLAVQDSIMDQGQIGDIYYGLSDGTAENFTRAQRDSKLINNAVNLRLRNGETMEAAIAGVSKDLYGDVQVVNDTNVQALIPKGQDPSLVVDGLHALMPEVETALATALAVPADAKTSDGSKAIMDAVSKDSISRVMSEGYFRNSGDGYVFIDAYVGAAIADAQGNPIIFKPNLTPKAAPTRSDIPADIGIRDAVMGQ